MCSLLGVIASGCWIYQHVRQARQMALCTNLWSSAQEGDNNSVIQFLKEGADPNCQDGEPLRRANTAGHQDTANILKRAGAKE